MATTILPKTMRALLHNARDQSLTIKSIPLLTPSADQYLVKPYAVALTTGELLWPRPDDLAICPPGVEFVARIVTAPNLSSRFQPGDEVYARVAYPNFGSAREYSLATEDEMALRPKNMSIFEAATVPVSALTSWQALFEQFSLTPPTAASSPSPSPSNLRILITAASGGVGIWAVQLAKLAGLRVTATCSTRNIDFVRSLGADDVLDYTTTSPLAWVEEDPQRKVDYVLDCAGGASLTQAWYAVKDGGQVLTIAPPADMQWKFVLDRPEGVSESISGHFFIMHPSGEQLRMITDLSEHQKVKAVVDSVWRLEEFKKALERLASGQTRGKVVLRVNEEKQSM